MDPPGKLSVILVPLAEIKASLRMREASWQVGMGRRTEISKQFYHQALMLCFQRKIIFWSWDQAVCPGYVKGVFLGRVCCKPGGAGKLLGEGRD